MVRLRIARCALAYGLVAGSCVSGLGWAGESGQSQESAPPATTATEIETSVVTANKRLQNLQDVGVSAQALSARDLRYCT